MNQKQNNVNLNDNFLIQHPKSREPMVNYTLDAPAKGYAALDPNHTHHFLVDDGIFYNNH